jgi:hypothetical protein
VFDSFRSAEGWSANDGRPVIAPRQTFVLGTGAANIVGKADASDPDPGDEISDGQIKGGSGGYQFAIDSASAQITIADASAIDFAGTSSDDLTLMVGNGKLPSLPRIETYM